MPNVSVPLGIPCISSLYLSSSTARFVKVSANICFGSILERRRLSIRFIKDVVLPVPGPASTTISFVEADIELCRNVSTLWVDNSIADFDTKLSIATRNMARLLPDIPLDISINCRCFSGVSASLMLRRALIGIIFLFCLVASSSSLRQYSESSDSRLTTNRNTSLCMIS